jgi:hypothetical protein
MQYPLTMDAFSLQSVTSKTTPLVASLMETTMQKHELKNTMEIRATPGSVADSGKIRLGGESPCFGPVRATVPPDPRGV